MSPQRVVRIKDLRVTQQRWVIWLACNHKISVLQEDAGVPLAVELANQDGVAECPFCPDVPSSQAGEPKSATQLWKEAGEP